MDVSNFRIDLKALITSPSFVLRGISILFCVIIMACIDRDGYFAGHCVFYSGGSSCSFALTVASIGFIYCVVYMGIDAIFLSIPQKYRRHAAMFDLSFAGFWTFVFFVLFCYMANHWQFSDADPNQLNLLNVNNIRASIAFAFFSIISWGGMAYTAYKRYNSIKNYNQYADDVMGAEQNAHSGDGGGGYIDYFNQPPAPVQTGFDASNTMDDELITNGQHRVGDTELLTS